MRKHNKAVSTILKLSICTFVALLFTRCGDSYLEDALVATQLEDGNFFASQEDAVSALNATYDPFHSGGYFKYHYISIGHMAGDTRQTDGTTQPAEQAYPGFKFNAGTGHLIPGVWRACYLGIQRANNSIAGITDMDDVLFSNPELKQQYIAEARFLRAFYYFELVRLYGGVPLITEVFDGDITNETAIFPTRNSVEEVYAQIESDFMAGADNLPNSYSDADIGRPTAGAAQAFLGKAYLYQKKYAQARDAFKSIIDGNFATYVLTENFGETFTLAGENNAESVFEIQFQSGFGTAFAVPVNEANWIANWFNPTAQFPFGFRNSVPSKQAIEFFEQYPEEDAERRFYTYAKPGDTWGRWDPVAEDPVAAQQWRARNILVPYPDDPDFQLLAIRKHSGGFEERGGFNQNPNNHRVMRYSDVLLMFAEAENEVNGPSGDAYNAINMVRQRAGVPVVSGLSKEEFFEQIVVERRLEFMYEFHRYFDLLRWGRGDEMPGFVANKNELLPIPAAQVTNNPNLNQNPGY
ncbi:RagB/SusD family nutrient uptake outer membrane protein [Flagellimonas sp. 389]|uniref:RagB/SusD family nutrient uptake outer membrane protein n=1 Tax=Flagellimonas sp. 389 TaxID=2835862 RepID=UPI001BD3C464|nr:RagB/SusD family nutrient uptake outer membrane protein [Flagellimonas sp. 389]MBS9462583.1 RagB/SusD family nutrient uptake outer membrane protein [Flagellimonas sp. 389]